MLSAWAAGAAAQTYTTNERIERALRRELAAGRLYHCLQGIQGTRAEVAEYHTQRSEACEACRL